MNKVYIFARGGVLQGVRATEECEVVVVDYDNAEGRSDDIFELDAMDCTFAELEATTRGVW